MEVYEPKSNSIGYALKRNLKAAPSAKRGVDFYKTDILVTRS